MIIRLIFILSISAFPLFGEEIQQLGKAAPFWGDTQSYIRTALVFDENGKPNRTRRGVVLRLGNGVYTCFDTDLLRYSATWRAKKGRLPFSLDSMAAASYPYKNAKSKFAPRLIGNDLTSTPELSGVGLGSSFGVLGGLFQDPRTGVSNSSGEKLGRLPRKLAQWNGISLDKNIPSLHYQIGKTKIKETLFAMKQSTIVRTLEIASSDETLFILLGEKKGLFKKHIITKKAAEIEIISSNQNGDYLKIKPYDKSRVLEIRWSDKTISLLKNKSVLTVDPLEQNFKVTSQKTKKLFPINTRNIKVPHNNALKRPVRMTDIGFLANGDAIISTLDGDIWRVQDIECETANWSRIARGIYEPMSLSLTEKNQIFILGRDQVTELVDTNGDGFYNFHRCASDAFFQTLHTRDFSNSLVIDSNGDFIISKGGIRKIPVTNKDENSIHRGAIIRLPADGGDAVVLADGLRMPFIGKNDKGQIFASDQQGHFEPSTPLYKLGGDIPSYGFDPTNHRAIKQADPILWFPYRSNRSATNFITLPSGSFPDFPDQFTNLSWNGRLFALQKTDSKLPFSVRLPIQLDFPLLNAAKHPKNGKLYGVGLGMSAYKPDTKKKMGLCELEQLSPIPRPEKLTIEKNKIEISFSNPVPNGMKLDLKNIEIKAWNIKKSARYGSGHFRWDKRPGEHLIDYKVVFSKDRKTLVMKTSAIYRSSILKIVIPVINKRAVYPLEVSASPLYLEKPDSNTLITLQKEKIKKKLRRGNRKLGKQLFIKYACATCHSVTGRKLNGPALNGINKRHGAIYIRDSILYPEKVITDGYQASMPSFSGVVKDQDLEDIIAYLRSLK